MIYSVASTTRYDMTIDSTTAITINYLIVIRNWISTSNTWIATNNTWISTSNTWISTKNTWISTNNRLILTNKTWISKKLCLALYSYIKKKLYIKFTFKGFCPGFDLSMRIRQTESLHLAIRMATLKKPDGGI